VIPLPANGVFAVPGDSRQSEACAVPFPEEPVNAAEGALAATCCSCCGGPLLVPVFLPVPFLALLLLPIPVVDPSDDWER
jgi:hypothetical protein